MSFFMVQWEWRVGKRETCERMSWTTVARKEKRMPRAPRPARLKTMPYRKCLTLGHPLLHIPCPAQEETQVRRKVDQAASQQTRNELLSRARLKKSKATCAKPISEFVTVRTRQLTYSRPIDDMVLIEGMQGRDNMHSGCGRPSGNESQGGERLTILNP